MSSTGQGTHDDPIVYSYDADTPEERKANVKRNMEQFSKDAEAGKIICLSGLIGGAEQVHIDNLKKAQAVKAAAKELTELFPKKEEDER